MTATVKVIVRHLAGIVQAAIADAAGTAPAVGIGALELPDPGRWPAVVTRALTNHGSDEAGRQNSTHPHVSRAMPVAA